MRERKDRHFLVILRFHFLSKFPFLWYNLLVKIVKEIITKHHKEIVTKNNKDFSSIFTDRFVNAHVIILSGEQMGKIVN